MMFGIPASTFRTIVIALFATALLLAAASRDASATISPAVLKGDVNCDSSVGPEDARQMLLFAANLPHDVHVDCLFVSLAQPAGSPEYFGQSLEFEHQPEHGYIEVPHDPALNPTDAITIEAWVYLDSIGAGEDCRSLVGKNFLQAYWLGTCNQGKLRFYPAGGASARTSTGAIPANHWTHVAVTYEENEMRFYINGELVDEYLGGGALTTSDSPLRIGSDVSWQFSPDGHMDEVRIWNAVRTQEQIRQTMFMPLFGVVGFDTLVAGWSMNGSADDISGVHNGVLTDAAAFTVETHDFQHADVNCSGTLDGLDALEVLFYAADFERDLPGNCRPIGSGNALPAARP